MKQTLLRHLILSSMALASLPAFAGKEVGNGGDAVICPGKKPVVLDYLYASLPSPANPSPNIEKIDGLTAEQVVKLFRDKIKDTLFGESFDRALAEIGDLNQWILADGLSDISDDGLGFNLPAGCHLAQAAVREGSAIYLERSLFEQMEPSQIGMLVVHEVLYKLAVEKGKKTSATTRQVIRALAQRKLSLPVVEGAVHALGWNYSHFELLSDAAAKNQYETHISFMGRIEIQSIDPVERSLFLKFYYGPPELPGSLMWYGYFKCDYSNRCTADFTQYYSYNGQEKMKWVQKGDYLLFIGSDALEHHMMRDGRHLWSRYKKL